ncbi:MAG: glycosyltransferase, partial [Selenomonadaceae bacterium]|nr:glycosyltransferase [Selenomonadaceae bacterium]
MRIIVSGGGTGGHIYPALTLIRTIQNKMPEAEFLYVGTELGLESDIIPKENLPFIA